MKKNIFLMLLTLLILTGCTSKSNFSLTFDQFTLKIYDNKKSYSNLPLDTTIGMNVLTEMKENTTTWDTGFINSLIVIKTDIQSWTDIKTFVTSNTKTLQRKLLKYTSTNNTSKNIKCTTWQYSWYITAFSYLLDKQTLYDGQYFFTTDESIYIISLTSDDQKDIKSFIKSIGTIKCI